MLECTLHSAVYCGVSRTVPQKPTQVARNAMMSIFRTLLLAFAVMSSVLAESGAWTGGLGRRGPHDALCVRALHFDRQAFQPRPLFEPGSCPAPHCCFKALPRCGRGHPDDPSRGLGRRRHGRRGWRGGSRAGRPTPACR
jgi:hypothetical protein